MPEPSRCEAETVDLAREAIETLRAADFPVYAVPPSRWHGDVMLGGVSGGRKHPRSIHMRYDDDLGTDRPERRIEVTSTGAEGLSRRAPFESFLLSEHSYSTEIVNFVNNIRVEPLPERPIAGSERFNAEEVDGKKVPRKVCRPSAGPRRLIDAVPFIEGSQMERVAFDELPELRLYRAQIPQVEVLILGWGWDDDSLEQFASSARPINEDATVFAEIERAEFAAWDKIRDRTGWAV
jgi:hypothetical protein